MRCDVCGRGFSVPATHVTVETAADKYLNRGMAVCEKCAYAIVGVMLVQDPLSMRCDADT